MHILFLSAWCPYPADNGSRLRVYHLLRGLGRRHKVDLLSFCPEGDDGSRAAHLGEFCRRVTLLPESPFPQWRVGMLAGLLTAQPRSMVANYSRTLARLVERQSASVPYDVVVASQLHMLPYAARIRTLPVIFEELEVALLAEPARQGPRASRLRYQLTWWKTRRYVGAALRRSAGFSVASPEERNLLAPFSPPGLPVAVVPNGVDTAGCAAARQEPEPDTLVYPGPISYDANFDAVAHFLNAILPLIRRERPSARLRVTGRATREQIRALPPSEGVEFTGYLDDVRPTVAGAWAEVVPLRKGGGTRLKVLEALALGTPVISTPKGVEGLELRPGHDLLVADTPEEFARQTLRLLVSPDLRAELAARGREAAQRYDWEHSVRALEGLLERVVGGA